MDNLPSLLAERAGRIGDHPYILFRDRILTYEEVNSLSNRFAYAFRELGLGKGDHVAVMLSNCPEWIACWFGLAKLGAVLVAFNTQWKAEGIRYALEQADIKCYLVGAEYQDEWKKIQENPARLKIVFDVGGEEIVLSQAHALAGMLRAAPADDPGGEPPSGMDPLILTYTSGTTGRPKAVVNPHRAYIAAAEDLRDTIQITRHDVIYSCLPLYHANPQVYCVLTALAAEGTVALAERFSASRFWKEIRAYRATAFSYVGAVLPILLNQPQSDEEKKSSVKKCFGGGAPKEIHEAVTRRLGIQVCELYGMSETGTWNTINRPGEIRAGTVGKVRESFEVKIFDDQDNEMPVGSIGEFVVRPRKPFIMFHGYYKMPAETLTECRNLWFHTGDLGKVDAEGYFYFCGRKKESIRRGGENITPYEIEKVLTDHPSVAEAAAVGVPDPILGEEIKVYVVLRAGHSEAPESLIAQCRDRLPKYMIPRYLEFVAQLPKTASEKVQKVALKARGIGSSWDRLKGK